MLHWALARTLIAGSMASTSLNFDRIVSNWVSWTGIIVDSLSRDENMSSIGILNEMEVILTSLDEISEIGLAMTRAAFNEDPSGRSYFHVASKWLARDASDAAGILSERLSVRKEGQQGVRMEPWRSTVSVGRLCIIADARRRLTGDAGPRSPCGAGLFPATRVLHGGGAFSVTAYLPRLDVDEISC